jgi:hypothetical protein
MANRVLTPPPTASDLKVSYDDLAQKLQWRRAPDESGRYLSVYIEQNNTCNLKCRMCGFSDTRVVPLPRNHMPGWLYEAIARQIFPATTYLHKRSWGARSSIVAFQSCRRTERSRGQISTSRRKTFLTH